MLMFDKVAEAEFPARSVQVPPTDCPTPSLASRVSLGGLPADSPERLSEQAKLTVTGADATGAGSLTATCSDALDNVGNAAAAVSVHYLVDGLAPAVTVTGVTEGAIYSLSTLPTPGCDTTDVRYFRYGIGTDLYPSDIVATTDREDLYLAELCRQSSSVISPLGGQCIDAAPSDWSLIVQAGMNDIDRRCDGYLAWLDDRRPRRPR